MGLVRTVVTHFTSLTNFFSGIAEAAQRVGNFWYWWAKGWKGKALGNGRIFFVADSVLCTDLI